MKGLKLKHLEINTRQTMARVVSSPFKEWLSFINTELATIAAQIFCCTEIFQKLTAAFLDNTLIAMTMAGSDSTRIVPIQPETPPITLH